MSSPEFYRYLVYKLDDNNKPYPFPYAHIYARDEAEAWEVWENYAVDGPSKVTIIYNNEKQTPEVRVL